MRSMSDEKIYPVPEGQAARAWIDSARYETLYRESIESPERFWREQAESLDWIAPFTEVKDVSFNADDLHGRHNAHPVCTRRERRSNRCSATRR